MQTARFVRAGSGAALGSAAAVWSAIVVASIATGFAVVEPRLVALIAIGAACAIAFRWPAVSVLFVVVVSQEQLAPRSDPAATSFAFGSDLYFSSVARMPVVFWIVLIAAIGGLTRWRKQGVQLDAAVRVFVICVAAMVGWSLLFSVGRGGSVGFALGNTALPFILVLLAFAASFTIDHQPGGRALLVKAGWIAILLAAIQGAVTILLRRGQVVVVDGGTNAATYLKYLLYYDTSLPALAGAVLLSIALYNRRRIAGLVAAAWIVFFSYRRSVWAGIALILAAAAVLSPIRARALRPILAICAVLLVVSVAAFPSIAASAGSRIVEGYITIAEGPGSGSSDVSTSGHLRDLESGWAYAMQRPIEGWGPDRRQLPGLGVNENIETRLYVHNEFLLNWLRFGIGGMLLVLLGVVALVRAGIATLRRQLEPSLERRVAAFFVLIFPICAVTAPFLTTTSRWPILVGLAAGILAVSAYSSPTDAPAMSTDDRL